MRPNQRSPVSLANIPSPPAPRASKLRDATRYAARETDMPENPTFVVNDRRKFTAEGELRHDATPSPDSAAPAPQVSAADDRSAAPVLSFPQATATQAAEQDVLDTSTPAIEQLSDLPESGALDQMLPSANSAQLTGPDDFADELDASYDSETLPPGPTEEESTDALRAYEATVDRLDTALRAADPGGDRLPSMSFERLTQSLYTQALMLLGGGTQPGEQPRVDILGARQTIDMLAVIADKTKGNLSPAENKLMQSALFDLRLGFLEITQALARQAAQRQPAGPGALGGPGGPGTLGGFAGGPRIVR